jgi:Gram-negative bacterial TonB protein C-terminal
MAFFISSWTRKLISPFPRVLIVLVLAGIVFAPARQAEADKPRVYNLIVKEVEPVDQMIRERYGSKYDVVEFREDKTYVWARLTKSRYPNPVYDENNVEVVGSVRVCFIVTTDGRLVDPFIVRAADRRLEGPVLNVLKEYRATPARLNGAPVATVETMKFTFGPPPRRRIDYFR